MKNILLNLIWKRLKYREQINKSLKINKYALAMEISPGLCRNIPGTKTVDRFEQN